MNHVNLMGRLVAEPELKKTSSGKEVLTFTVAVERISKEKNQADFIVCVAWEHNARFIAQWFSKGKMIAIDGQIQTRPWVDKSQNKRTAVEVLVNRAYFTGEKAVSAANTQRPEENVADCAAADANNDAPAYPEYEQVGLQNSFEEIDGEEDLPF